MPRSTSLRPVFQGNVNTTAQWGNGANLAAEFTTASAGMLHIYFSSPTAINWGPNELAPGLGASTAKYYHAIPMREFDFSVGQQQRQTAQFGIIFPQQMPQTIRVIFEPLLRIPTGQQPAPVPVPSPPTPIPTPVPTPPTPVPVPNPTPPIPTPIPIPPTPIPTPPSPPGPIPPTPTGPYNYGEVLQKSLTFYLAQRSGKLPENFPLEWRGDSGLNDGSDNGVDLSGGYHDAGDHVKFGLPMAYTITMLAWGGIEYKAAYEQAGLWEELKDAVKWGTDYLMKAHTAPNEFYGQVGLGNVDHAWWGPPEFMQMERPSFKLDPQNPGSDLAGEAAAALTAASILFKEDNPSYSASMLVHAEQLFNFANQYRGKYSDSITDAAGFYASNGYMDELVWSAMWLYRATGNATYLTFARNNSRDMVKKTFIWTQNWDDKQYGAVMLLHQLDRDPDAKEAIENWLDFWTTGGVGGRLTTSPGGLKYLSVWGSLRYATTTAFLAALYLDINRRNNIPIDPEKEKRYSELVDSQVNYALGSNPQKRSYVVGFGQNPPMRAHHRAAHGSWANDMANPDLNLHILYGALVGGPNDKDEYQDDRNNYINNEVAMDYNAGFTGALAAMVQRYGGRKLDNFPPKEQRQPEFIVTGYVSSRTPNGVQITTFLNNRSGWPPRSPRLMFRYFIAKSNAGQAVSYYNEGATVSELRSWSPTISYVEVTYPAGSIFHFSTSSSRKQTQLSFSQNPSYDPSQDWSYTGMSTTEGLLQNVAVYADDVLAFGNEPPR